VHTPVLTLVHEAGEVVGFAILTLVLRLAGKAGEVVGFAVFTPALRWTIPLFGRPQTCVFTARLQGRTAEKNT